MYFTDANTGEFQFVFANDKTFSTFNRMYQ